MTREFTPQNSHYCSATFFGPILSSRCCVVFFLAKKRKKKQEVNQQPLSGDLQFTVGGNSRPLKLNKLQSHHRVGQRESADDVDGRKFFFFFCEFEFVFLPD